MLLVAPAVRQQLHQAYHMRCTHPHPYQSNRKCFSVHNIRKMKIIIILIFALAYFVLFGLELSRKKKKQKTKIGATSSHCIYDGAYCTQTRFLLHPTIYIINKWQYSPVGSVPLSKCLISKLIRNSLHCSAVVVDLHC